MDISASGITIKKNPRSDCIDAEATVKIGQDEFNVVFFTEDSATQIDYLKSHDFFNKLSDLCEYEFEELTEEVEEAFDDAKEFCSSLRNLDNYEDLYLFMRDLADSAAYEIEDFEHNLLAGA